MAKNIILLSDGTGNSAGKLSKTNVWRTYEALDLTDPQKQVAMYDDGVGTSTFKPTAILGGALGLGLSRNVRELYCFLARHYQPGDRIFCFGFSRGAFTIRTLAGFIAHAGVPKDAAAMNPNFLWRVATLKYRAYRKHHSSGGRHGGGKEPLLASVFRGVRDRLPWSSLKRPELAPERFHTSTAIEFLGLWDTVAAYGLPIDELTIGWDKWVWPISMSNFDLSSKVKRAVHALCLDDERNTFHPLLWNEAPAPATSANQGSPGQPDTCANISEERISQVWFAGMHADAGGGYADDWMSYVPLDWVLRQAERVNAGDRKAQILFKPGKRKEHAASANKAGVMHNSRQGLQALYRLLPRKLAKLCDSQRSSLDLRRSFGLASAFAEQMVKETGVVRIKSPKIHHSVFDRMKAPGAGYAPIVLPGHYRLVDRRDAILDLAESPFETAEASRSRQSHQERAWDLVWWRRIAYFSTIFAAFVLALMPWIPHIPGLRNLPLLSTVTLGDKCIASYLCFLSSMVETAGSFAPALFNPWVKSFSANPDVLGVLLAAIAGLWATSTKLDGAIRKRMADIWTPPAGATARPPGKLHAFRESGTYQAVFNILKYHAFPAVFGISSMLGILYLGLVIPSRTIFSLADAKGVYCEIEQQGPPRPVALEKYESFDFQPKTPCAPSGMLVLAGAAYRIVLDTTSQTWDDGGLKADATGVYEGMAAWKAVLAWPAKRYLGMNYFSPVARVFPFDGNRDVAGQDEYPLEPAFKSAGERQRCLVADFEAVSSGQLYFFVNDAIMFFKPDGVARTYANNHGGLSVRIIRIPKPGAPFELPPGLAHDSACNEFARRAPDAAK